MLLTELLSTDAADFDWIPYMPILLHISLLNFDNPKQLIGEHAKKLLLSLMLTLTIQCNLPELTEQLIIANDSILDNQSIIYDRKYTNNNNVDSANPIMASIYNRQIGNNPLLSVGNCHYNYFYNSSVFPCINGSLFTEKSTRIGLKKRPLVNTNSAPVSPYQQKSQDEIKPSLKLCSVQKTNEFLSGLIQVLAKSKNNPVWPYEVITSQNYHKKLISIEIIDEFVTNLKKFLASCSIPEEAKTVGSSNWIESRLESVCWRWSQYALNAGLYMNTSSFACVSRHYAGRSLQIYRALGFKFRSFGCLVSVERRLQDTVADASEEVQGYVTELLLTLKMNANLLVAEYLSGMQTRGDGSVPSDCMKGGSDEVKKNEKESLIKQKSKSLQMQMQQSGGGKIQNRTGYVS